MRLASLSSSRTLYSSLFMSPRITSSFSCTRRRGRSAHAPHTSQRCAHERPSQLRPPAALPHRVLALRLLHFVLDPVGGGGAGDEHQDAQHDGGRAALGLARAQRRGREA
jgi:hypothetical protein